MMEGALALVGGPQRAVSYNPGGGDVCYLRLPCFTRVYFFKALSPLSVNRRFRNFSTRSAFSRSRKLFFPICLSAPNRS